MSAVVIRRQAAELVRRSHAGLDIDALRGDVLRRLRAMLTVDAAFVATVDPATLLFTSAFAEDPLADAGPLFLANEFAATDVNKFSELADAPRNARSLDMATGSERSLSARYREIMEPLGLGDELRVALRTGAATWGVLCLHRAAGMPGFSRTEVELVEKVAPHIGAGLRHGFLLAHDQPHEAIEGVGLVVLDANAFTVASANAVGQRMLGQLIDPNRETFELPVAVRSVAAHAIASRRERRIAAPSARLCTPMGQWLRVEATVLDSLDGAEQVAVVLESLNPRDIASLLLDAYALTRREREITELVVRGYATRQIVADLQISAYTVQDHLKSIFEKFGVGSRRELVGVLMGAGHL
jgi:DNA-binding CsgD family transcriptional regulator/GAF domain-containing protein